MGERIGAGMVGLHHPFPCSVYCIGTHDSGHIWYSTMLPNGTADGGVST